MKDPWPKTKSTKAKRPSDGQWNGCLL